MGINKNATPALWRRVSDGFTIWDILTIVGFSGGASHYFAPKTGLPAEIAAVMQFVLFLATAAVATFVWFHIRPLVFGQGPVFNLNMRQFIRGDCLSAEGEDIAEGKIPLLVNLEIINVGHESSVAKDWRIAVVRDGVKTFTQIHSLASGGVFAIGNLLTVSNDDMLYFKAAKPIGRGEMRDGYIWTMVPAETHSSDLCVYIECKDAFGKVTSIEGTSTDNAKFVHDLIA